MATQNAKQLFRCVIMGPPGSGKGTIAERIVKYFDIIHFPSGDYLRREIREGTGKNRNLERLKLWALRHWNLQRRGKKRKRISIAANSCLMS